MTNPSAVNTFIAQRASGLTLDEIRAQTGVSLHDLSEWDHRFRPEVERVKESLLDKIAAYLFEDLKNQLAISDRLIAKLESDLKGAVIHPTHAERGWSALVQVMNSRERIVERTFKLLLEYEDRKRPLKQPEIPHGNPPNFPGGSEEVL